MPRSEPARIFGLASRDLYAVQDLRQHAPYCADLVLQCADLWVLRDGPVALV
tara:strand:+ start:97 stop:252 length:156 start_codon:yes stop_codon:yes gene_type:complete